MIMFNFMKKKEIPKTTHMQMFTLAGVTFDDRQFLIKNLKLREELKIIKYNYQNEIAYKVLNSESKQIGSIRKSDIDIMNNIYDKIEKVNVLGTDHFTNENGETVLTCQINVTYYE